MKKVISSLLLGASLLTLAPQALAVETDPSAFECGDWTDVSSSYLDAITYVCDSELMGGMSSSSFGGAFGITRAMAATIGSRIVVGPSDYNDMSHSTGYYIAKLEAYFKDIPPDETWNEWIVKAMYVARINYVMTGDGDLGNGLTNFRYDDDVTTAEFLKILFESAHSRGLLNNYGGSNLSYNGNPWYEDIVALYDGLGLLDDYSVDGEHFIEFKVHFDPDSEDRFLTLNLDLDATITRQNVAFLMYEMIHRGIMVNPNI